MTKSAQMSVSNLIPVSEIVKAQQRVKEVIVETPFMENYNLSQRYGCNIFLKREDMQVVRSFKIRGAYNKMKSLTKSEIEKGIVCASAGNHAQGVALACAKLEIKGKIYMPNPTPNQKITKVKLFGKAWVEVILVGDTFDDAYSAAKVVSDASGMAFIHPFEDDEVIAGQGTIAVEMLSQAKVKLDYLLVAVGGGGLLSGVGSYFKQLSPDTKIIAVEASGAPALTKSLEANQVVRLDHIDSFADGIAVKQVGEKTFQYCKSIVDRILNVEEGAICSTILQLYNDEAIVVEPAGAISVAALEQVKTEIKGKNIGIIICGGNNDVSRTSEIRERALLYEGKKHYFIIRFPQRAGALRDFLNVLGPNDDIAHFEYTKKNNRDSGPALVGIELKDSTDFDQLLSRMNSAGINYEHLNNNPMLFEMLV